MSGMSDRAMELLRECKSELICTDGCNIYRSTVPSDCTCGRLQLRDAIDDFLSAPRLPDVDGMTEVECKAEIEGMGYEYWYDKYDDCLCIRIDQEDPQRIEFRSATKALIFARRYLKRQEKGEK
jgi:hypothetical protein